MKKIGRQVFFLPTNEQVKRNGEGAFIRLKDGRIMFAYTEYCGLGGGDHDWAQLVAIYSSEEGETWGDRRVLMQPQAQDANIMSVSFLRMQNGDLGMFFLRKTNGLCRLYLARSADEGVSWYEETACCDEGYYVVNNDRIVRLKNGNILFPANLHVRQDSGYSVQYIFASEDDGKTWKKLGEPMYHPFPNSTTGLQESGLFQYEDESLLAWARTRSGSQFLMHSQDGGVSFTTPCGSELFTGPDSPMQVKKVGAATVAIFNPKPRYCGRVELETAETGKKLWARTPFVCLVSRDGGRTFPEGYLLEDDPANAYCYPAVFEGDDYFLVAYYHSNDSGVCLSSCKLTKVMYSELQDGYTVTNCIP